MDRCSYLLFVRSVLPVKAHEAPSGGLLRFGSQVLTKTSCSARLHCAEWWCVVLSDWLPHPGGSGRDGRLCPPLVQSLAHSRRRRTSGSSAADSPVVDGVGPYPEPHHHVFVFDSKRPVRQADPSGPKAFELLEMQRRVLRVASQQLVRLVGQASIVRKLPIASAKPRISPVPHRSVQRPARRSSRASSPNARPAVPPRRHLPFAGPGLGVEFGKPCPECVELGRRQPQSGLLDLIHTAHDPQRTGPVAAHNWPTSPRSPLTLRADRRHSYIGPKRGSGKDDRRGQLPNHATQTTYQIKNAGGTAAAAMGCDAASIPARSSRGAGALHRHFQGTQADFGTAPPRNIGGSGVT